MERGAAAGRGPGRVSLTCYLDNYSSANRMAETKGRQYVKQFAQEMWRQCGMRVVVMAAWKGQNGQPMMGMYVTSHLWYLYTHIHRHDFNSALGQGKTFADWDDIKHHWDAYAQQAIGGEEHDDSDEDARPTLCRKKGQKRPQTVLPTMEDGTPMIPIILDMQALERKDVMRTFVTWHYRKFFLVNKRRIDPLPQARHAASQVPVFLGLPYMQRLVSTFHLCTCCGIGSSKSRPGSQIRKLQRYWNSGAIGK